MLVKPLFLFVFLLLFIAIQPAKIYVRLPYNSWPKLTPSDQPIINQNNNDDVPQAIRQL